MIGDKVLLINYETKHPEYNNENFLGEVVDFDKVKYSIAKNLKNGGHIFIWIVLRSYILSLNFLNKKRKEISKKIKEKMNKTKFDENGNPINKQEVSKYLKVISEYRQKIRRIKHKIKEEEGIE